MRGGLLARSTDLGRSFEVVRRWEDRAGARVVAVDVAAGRKVVGVGRRLGHRDLRGRRGDVARVRAGARPGERRLFHRVRPRPAGRSLLRVASATPSGPWTAGRTWARIANGMVEDTEVFAIDFSPDDPNDFWAATCGWVYRTTDGGANWTRYREGLADRRTHAVRVDPRDPNRVLAGTTGGLFESRDRGKTFRRISADVVVNALVFDPRDPSRLLVGTEAEGSPPVRGRRRDAHGVEPRPLGGARLGRRAASVGPRRRRACRGREERRPVERGRGHGRRRAARGVSAGDRALARVRRERAPRGRAGRDLPAPTRAGAPFAKVLDARNARVRVATAKGGSLAATNEGVFESANGGQHVAAPRHA